MEDVTQYYGGMKTTASFKETRYSQFMAKDSVDGCVQNGHVRVQTNSSFESKTSYKYTSDMAETKSFIQQSVERLYGPGALAQGFFISKRQKNNRRLSESEEKLRAPDGDDAHSRSMTDHLLLEDELGQLSMRQSASTPTLPVLRHLRPEFRAQLPIHSPRRGLVEEAAQKVATASKLKLDEEEEDEQEVVVKLNGHDEGTRESDGHVKISNGHASEKSNGYLKGTSNGELQIAEDDKEELETKDGHYFLKILETQTKRLLALADRVEEDLTSPELSEEVIGKLRSASGKARLLASQKMQQFRGLCTNNINRSLDEAFPTTNEDLQGFWDMVMLQVNQVYAIFDEIDELRRNDWLEETGAAGASPATNGTAPKAKRGSGGRPKTSPTAPQNEEARKQRERDRKRMIEERRKAMRAQQRGKGAEGVEFFVTESS